MPAPLLPSVIGWTTITYGGKLITIRLKSITREGMLISMMQQPVIPMQQPNAQKRMTATPRQKLMTIAPGQTMIVAVLGLLV